ncbi:MAG: hypothetical protein FJ087_23555 [Deltaproteobacteria bacterium]|nr:hypothetical protein [Deltaproteobacteria bacterium]
MAKLSTSRFLADELRRVLNDFRRVDADIERLAAERNRLSTVTHRLLQLLRRLVGPRAADRLVGDLGLAEVLAKPPAQPGRKPAVATTPAGPAAAPPAAGVGKTVPEPIAAGTPIRIETGKYAWWTGTIRWTHVKGTTRTYTATVTGPDGKRTRAQVAHATILRSHLINPEHLRPDAFDDFIRRRACGLLDLIEKATGKAASGRDPEEVFREFGGALKP